MSFLKVLLVQSLLLSAVQAVPSPREESALNGRAPCEHSPTSRGCWGEYSIDTDYTTIAPDTGAIKEVLKIAPLINENSKLLHTVSSIGLSRKI